MGGDLKYLGRKHSLQEALEAISEAKKIFSKFSFDLIYARHKNHTISQWENELKAALEITSGHLSLYSLTIEPNTPFHHKHTKKQLFLPLDSVSEEMYEKTVTICENFGMNQYEISNFALPGHESKHNLNYWNSGEWIGIGPGAASRLNLPERTAFSQIRNPNKWMNSVTQVGHGAAEIDVLTKDEYLEEILMMGLRTKQGVSNGLLSAWIQEIQRTPPATIQKFLDMNLIGFRDTTIYASSLGMAVLNSILPDIVATLPNIQNEEDNQTIQHKKAS